MEWTHDADLALKLVEYLAIDRRRCIGLLGATALAPSWARSSPKRTIALLFDSLISPFWVAAIERLHSHIAPEVGRY